MSLYTCLVQFAGQGLDLGVLEFVQLVHLLEL